MLLLAGAKVLDSTTNAQLMRAIKNVKTDLLLAIDAGMNATTLPVEIRRYFYFCVARDSKSTKKQLSTSTRSRHDVGGDDSVDIDTLVQNSIQEKENAVLV